jgi:iron complex transport system substrate-binding protein
MVNRMAAARKARASIRFARPKFVGIAVLLILISAVAGARAGRAAEFRDALGRSVSLSGTPQRIVALAPSLAEILFYLGLGNSVVGVTRYSDYPPEAVSRPKIGSYVNLNVERIISLAPDLVIGTADGNQPDAVGLLEEAGIPVFIVNPRNVREVIGTVASLGRICGVPQKGSGSAWRLNRRVGRVRRKTEHSKRPLVFLQINPKPIMSVNRNTFHHDLLRLAGARNMTADEPANYPRISLEEVIRRKPQVILISSMQRGGRFAALRREWMQWKSIPAVQFGRVHLIDSDRIDRPSPRMIDGLEDMARLIHPEIEWD